MLELQSNAISTLANNQIPGTNTWEAVINWLNDFIQPLENEYDVVFLDANPSFSMYTQIAIASTIKVILPVMADDSSRRAIQNAFSFDSLECGIMNLRDFQTTGVVSVARGCPLQQLKSGRLELMGKRAVVKEDYRQNCIENVKKIVSKISKDL